MTFRSRVFTALGTLTFAAALVLLPSQGIAQDREQGPCRGDCHRAFSETVRDCRGDRDCFLQAREELRICLLACLEI